MRLATCDAAGGGLGSGADELAFTIIRTTATGPALRVVQEVGKGWRAVRGQPMDLPGVVGGIAAYLRAYGLSEIYGDAYAGQWVQQAFEAVGIRYRVATLGASAAGAPRRWEGRHGPASHQGREDDRRSRSQVEGEGGRVGCAAWADADRYTTGARIGGSPGWW